MSVEGTTMDAAAAARGWLRAHAFLIARRSCQLGVLALFLLGPLAGIWIVQGNLSSSVTLDVLPLTDPFVLLQALAAGHRPASDAVLGAVVIVAVYAVVGGRVYCAWVCPVNLVTDAAFRLRQRIGLGPGWQPARRARRWLLAMVLALSALGGALAWELVNPVTLLHRGLLFGIGAGWTVIAAVFVLDLIVSRRGWCGRLCPMGAFYGLLGRWSLLRVRADRRARCNDCMDCIDVCPEPQVIMPTLKGAAQGLGPVILDADCTNCGRCIDVCSRCVFTFGRRWPNRLLPTSAQISGGTIP